MKVSSDSQFNTWRPILLQKRPWRPRTLWSSGDPGCGKTNQHIVQQHQQTVGKKHKKMGDFWLILFETTTAEKATKRTRTRTLEQKQFYQVYGETSSSESQEMSPLKNVVMCRDVKIVKFQRNFEVNRIAETVTSKTEIVFWPGKMNPSCWGPGASLLLGFLFV